MKEERLLVLNMLKEGRIDIEEASQLLEVLSISEISSSARKPLRRKRRKKFQANLEENFNRTSDSIKNFAKEIGEKLETGIKEFEPKIKNVSKNIVEKTSDAVDSVSRSFNENIEDVNQNLEKLKDDLDKEIEEIEIKIENDHNSTMVRINENDKDTLTHNKEDENDKDTLTHNKEDEDDIFEFDDEDDDY